MHPRSRLTLAISKQEFENKAKIHTYTMQLHCKNCTFIAVLTKQP